jgi:hypothetical protein
MIDWSKGYSASYYATLVDPLTWNDLDRFEITGGSISREETDLRHSADIDTVNTELVGENYIRVYMTVRQDGDIDRIPLFTGLATSPSVNIEGLRRDNTFQCYSVLKPASDVLLRRGWFAAVDMNCRNLLLDLTSVIKAPVLIENSDARLTDYLVAEGNESHLTMIDKLLDLMNWRLTIDGDGTISIGPYPKSESVIFDSLGNDILEPSLSIERDWYNCPNVFRAVNNYDEYIEYDHSNNLWSIENRGREVWAEETNCDLIEGESLELYAKRRLSELQEVAEKVSYTRAFNPGVTVNDIIRLNYPAQNISGLFLVTSQKIDIGYSARTSEEVVKL